MIDPNANMIGSPVDITSEVKLNIIMVMESVGSDYARPDKGHVFNIVKFEVINNGSEAIELKEKDFKVLMEGQEYFPIEGRLNFVPDKMPASFSIAPGAQNTTKLVFMLPKKKALKLLAFKPSFAQAEIKFNLVE